MSENLKPSGIVWVGEIPQLWSLTRLQKVLQQVKAKNTGVKEKNLLSLSYGKIITKDIEGALGLIPESYDTYNIVKKGDIVLRLTDMQNDHVSLRTGLVKENQGIITSAYVTLRTTNENSSYYHWYLYAFDITKEIYSFGQGVRQNLTYEELKKMLIPIPPISEQTLIADFLDEKCEKIDNIATDIEKQIEILQKYKKSLIAETVTKGLDKLVSMKDSGIEWIGNVPENYSLVPLKNLFWMYAGGDVDEYDFSDERTDKYKYAIYSNSLENNGLFGYMSKYRFKGDTITVTGRGDVGKALPRYDAYYPIVRLLVCVPQKKLNVSFFSYCINCADILGDQTAMAQLTIQKLGVIKVPVPAYEEQSKIANYLDKKCLKIDSIIESKKEQLTHITQHKKSLIYEYVTGKKRVKGVKNNGN